jgi:hypothetical protein
MCRSLPIEFTTLIDLMEDVFNDEVPLRLQDIFRPQNVRQRIMYPDEFTLG